MIRDQIINHSRLILREKGIVFFSISSLAKDMKISKRLIINEFKNKQGILASILIDDLIIRYNIGTNILDDSKTSVLEKLCIYHALGVAKTLSNNHDRGVLFLLANPTFWVELSEEHKTELKDTFQKHFNFIKRIQLKDTNLKLSKNQSRMVAIKLNALERGLLVNKLNIVSAIENFGIDELISFFASEVSMTLNTSIASIDEYKVKSAIMNFMESPPDWASIYQSDGLETLK